VSFADPRDVDRVHRIGQSVMLDNGAYSLWRSGRATKWPDFYAWADRWLDYPTTWAVIPDIIGAGAEEQDALLRDWPFGKKGAPVWHMDEPIDRLVKLTDTWPRVCIGSSGVYAVVLSDRWTRRMDSAWEAVSARHRRTPVIHMLRGMQCSGRRWPFASVDSTDVARNHNCPHNSARRMMDRWDPSQCPPTWAPPDRQIELDICEAGGGL
jgi:hypothetical protein